MPVLTQPTLAPMDVAGRMRRLRNRIADGDCDGLLVTNRANVRYLTGFTGSAGMLLVLPDRSLLTTDGRYQTQAAEELAAAGVETDLVVGQVDAQNVALGHAAEGHARLGLEASSVTWATQRSLAKAWRGQTKLVPTEGLVEGLRAIKDPGEVDRIRAAADIADDALVKVLPMLRGGLSEAEFGLALDFEMRRLGASDVSFETIVAAGPNGAKPHARPSGRRIADGELIVVDFGALVDGYHSDMTRTVCVGTPANPVLDRMVEAVTASQAAGVAAVRAGVEVAVVDAACRSVLGTYGWEEAFVHGTGHGVGLEIHEAPGINSASVDTLEAGHVVTVEPGVYLPEHGGVRIEDTVVVTAEGCVALTHAPKDLIVA